MKGPISGLTSPTLNKGCRYCGWRPVSRVVTAIFRLLAISVECHLHTLMCSISDVWIKKTVTYVVLYTFYLLQEAWKLLYHYHMCSRKNYSSLYYTWSAFWAKLLARWLFMSKTATLISTLSDLLNHSLVLFSIEYTDTDYKILHPSLSVEYTHICSQCLQEEWSLHTRTNKTTTMD